MATRDESALGPVISVGEASVRVGTSSWADASLVKDTDWYPRRSMTAAQRLAYFASRFPVAIVDTTFWFPPTPEVTASWVERTPDGFVLDVAAWSLLTGHPAFPHSLWPDLQDEVRPEFRDRRNLYAKHLTPAAVAESWSRFVHALHPLVAADRLGTILLQYPRWFGPKEARRDVILGDAERVGDLPVAVEFQSPAWLHPDECESTLAFLEDNGLGFVCVDEPQGFPSSIPPVVAATADLALVRLDGRNAEHWVRRGGTRYVYSDDELAGWSERIRELAASATDVHVLFNNCWRDFAVRNAATLQELLGGPGPPPRPSA
jgi:uncharacterized protein YecE (DUF72 family)